MEIIGDQQKMNFTPSLQLLLDAMKEGKTIKSVTCMAGTINKDNREKDFKIENFVADSYWIGFSSQGEKYFDYVDTNKRAFYMNWVLKFEL